MFTCFNSSFFKSRCLVGELLNIPDWETLMEACEFDLTYLHLEQEQPAA
jgi:hypothetical protein